MKNSQIPIRRRQAREWAVQLLFQLDFDSSLDVETMFESFWEQQWHTIANQIKDETGASPLPPESSNEAADVVAPARIRSTVEYFVKGVLQHRDEIDERIAAYVQNWSVNRMAVVERNVLRLAFFEIFYSDQTPPVIVLNEAIDIAKYYSNTGAGRFINGILDRAIKEKAKTAK